MGPTYKSRFCIFCLNIYEKQADLVFSAHKLYNQNNTRTHHEYFTLLFSKITRYTYHIIISTNKLGWYGPLFYTSMHWIYTSSNPYLWRAHAHRIRDSVCILTLFQVVFFFIPCRPTAYHHTPICTLLHISTPNLPSKLLYDVLYFHIFQNNFLLMRSLPLYLNKNVMCMQKWLQAWKRGEKMLCNYQ